MLSWLSISDFAVIDRVELEFESGMNVLTGETGSGKSILVDALGGLLGERLGPDFIRAGADRARIEAVFRIDRNDSALRDLEQRGFDTDGSELTISREIARSGRSVSRVNGELTPLASLREIGASLVDIHGQSQHLGLLRVPEHVRMLDELGGLTDLRSGFGRLAERFREMEREILESTRRADESSRQKDLLQYQLEEIRRAGLEEDEENALLAERDIVANAVALAGGADGAYRALAGDDGTSAIDLLARAVDHLAGIRQFDPSLAERIEQLESSLYQIEDAAAGLLAYRDGIEFAPGRLAQIEERLDLIQALKRKYGDGIPAILAFAASCEEQLNRIAGGQERSGQLETEREELRDELSLLGARLSEKRRATAQQLDSQVVRELDELALANASFATSIEQTESADGLRLPDGRSVRLDSTGVDRVEFLVSINPGSPLRGLSRIASGGETSRLMLALKSVLGRGVGLPVQVFDEIDAGIGGRVGRVVGQKLWNLGQERQLICVTHLPQVASFATSHFLVRKSAGDGQTITSVTILDSTQRVEELAAMLSGVTGSAASERNAQEMLQRADKWKQSQLASIAR